MLIKVSKSLTLLVLAFVFFSFSKKIYLEPEQKNELKEIYQEKPSRKSIQAGYILYTANCVRCHESSGIDKMNLFPPLAKSDYLLKDQKRAIKIVLFGAKGSMKVNGKIYRGKMSGESHLSDREIADLMNYINHSWGNKGKITTKSMVKKIRESR